MVRSVLSVLFVALMAVPVRADFKACRDAYKDKLWDQAFEVCHAEAVKADKGEGNKNALNQVAYLYMRGRGTGRDYEAAMRWFRKAADRGSGRAMNAIGLLYSKGWGVAEDEEEALRWYKKSAERGFYVGQYNYGIILVADAVAGRGTREDLVTGYMYLLLFQKQNRGTSRLRERTAHGMGTAEKWLTYSQIDEAKRRARKWKKDRH